VNYFAFSFVMHLRRLVPLLLLLPSGGARRSIRVGDSDHGFAEELEVSAKSRDALIPGGFRTGLARRAGQRAGASLHGADSGVRPAGRVKAPHAVPWPRAAAPVANLEDHVDTSDPLVALAIAGMEANSRRNRGRDVSMMAVEDEKVPTEADKVREKVLKVFSSVERDTREKLVKVIDEVDVNARLSLTAGVTDPMGFFDPLGFATADTMTGGKLLFYREVELKHGRVAMLAALGILVGEQFHPLFGGNIDVPSYIAFQQTPLQTFWPAVLVAIAIPEIFSVFSFQTPANIIGLQSTPGRELWAIRTDHVPGDLGFDPLGLKPTNPEEWRQMQNKELNNGRLAMIASAGMIAQELASGQKLF